MPRQFPKIFKDVPRRQKDRRVRDCPWEHSTQKWADCKSSWKPGVGRTLLFAASYVGHCSDVTHLSVDRKVRVSALHKLSQDCKGLRVGLPSFRVLVSS